MLGGAMLVFAWNLWHSFRGGALADNDPWDAWTLQWATTSPPPAYNFAPGTLPPIRSARPLWDLKHTPLASDVAGSTPRSGTVTPAPVRPTGTWFGRVSLPVLGTLTFLTSESVFFGALIATFVVYRNASVSGPGPHIVDVMRTGLFSSRSGPAAGPCG